MFSNEIKKPFFKKYFYHYVIIMIYEVWYFGYLPAIEKIWKDAGTGAVDFLISWSTIQKLFCCGLRAAMSRIIAWARPTINFWGWAAHEVQLIVCHASVTGHLLDAWVNTLVVMLTWLGVSLGHSIAGTVTGSSIRKTAIALPIIFWIERVSS